MAFLYDYRQFAQIREVADRDAHAMAQCIARDNKFSVVVEIGDDYYRVTPAGRRMRMPSWFMPSTLGGKP